MNIPILETERLILRALTIEDADAVFKWVSDERVTKYMPYNTYTSIEDVTKWLSTVVKNENTYNFGFVLKDNNILIGSGDIGYNTEEEAWDFGYNIRFDHWNRGYGTEAAKAMIRFAYESLNARCFSANHVVDNTASGRVMEKCGLKFDHYGECSKFDGTQTFKAKFYKGYINASE
ncbi:GNAT family N-acetyltransferase [Anaerocolumna sp. MB42-C2]|uniref:GNAT family N-acetyltransferase n=1 Tax=Anaerocolumna sp. MB42-C2 TaxID=3070997 RepID=UPI0027E021CF|nr:GNAT family N-acetyltransferase [Anaerocolumna sp. MB42-C2]WMJ87441.1 GNAT family N-acetyltransferase [Anaerocolumna sp. MB42-C2]